MTDLRDVPVGSRVRIRTAPDRVGVITGDVQEIAGRRRWIVQFPEGPQRLPETNLELVLENQSIESLIGAGGFGGVHNLRGAITHSRLTGRLADVIYSMEATNTDFKPYQFKPVLNFLDSPSNGILIADEVGLGKTIEAGLIWTELRARTDASRLLVLCPAMLREKWRKELLHKFGIRAEVCSAKELLQKLRDHEGGVLSDFAVIVSIQGMRPPRGWDEGGSNETGAAKLARYINDSEVADALFDCVIIDEAHYLRNPDSQTHKLAHLVRPISDSMVLLSATPIQLRSDDLFHLLNIIDDENFEFKRGFDEVLEANGPLVALGSQLRAGASTTQSIEEAVRDCLIHPLHAQNRQLTELMQNLPSKTDLESVDYRIRLANRIERINLLASVVNRTRKRDVQSDKVIRVPKAESIPMTDVERLFYERVTDEVRNYCVAYDLFEGFMLTIPQRQLCSSMPAALRSWLKKIDKFDDDILYETAGGETQAVSTRDTSGGHSKVGPLVQKLAQLAVQIGGYEELKENDSKYAHLKSLLHQYWLDNPSKKVILFSFYRETLQYLRERLIEDGVEATLLMGGMGDQKDDLIDLFESPDGPNLMLATEVLSEGVDLQFSSALINYDLPWNPMRVEQRIGRIDRIGQNEERIFIWNFFYDDTLDDRIYRRLFDRLEVFKYALGDLEAVLGEKIRRLTFDLLSHSLSKSEENERIEQTSSAIEQQRQQQEELEQEAVQLQAHGDYVLNRVTAAKELQRYIDGKSLWIYVRDYLKRNYAGSEVNRLDTEPLTAEVRLSAVARSDLQAYITANRAVGTTSLVKATTGKRISCVFDNRVDFGKTAIEVINQYHPLVRFVAERVSKDDFHPLVAVSMNASQSPDGLSGTYFFVVKRWSTVGARMVERLVYRAVELGSGKQLPDEIAERLVGAAGAIGEDWQEARGRLENSAVVAAYHQLEVLLDDQFESYCAQMTMENEDRVDFLIRTLQGQIARQIRSREEAIEKLRNRGQERLIKANMGMIAKLEEKRDQRIAGFEQQRRINSDPQDVIVGVCHVPG